MALNARAKGMQGEHEVIALLQPVVKKAYVSVGCPPDKVPDLRRNLMQTAVGGHDVIGLDWLALEVKRVEADNEATQADWWSQTVRQAEGAEKVDGRKREPVLFWRKNKRAWQIKMIGYLGVGEVNGGQRVRTVVSTDLESFLVWLELRVVHDLRTRYGL